MATHSSVLAWRIPGTGEPGGLPSMGSHRVGHNWSDLAAASWYLGCIKSKQQIKTEMDILLENWMISSVTLGNGLGFGEGCTVLLCPGFVSESWVTALSRSLPPGPPELEAQDLRSTLSSSPHEPQLKRGTYRDPYYTAGFKKKDWKFRDENVSQASTRHGNCSAFTGLQQCRLRGVGRPRATPGGCSQVGPRVWGRTEGTALPAKPAALWPLQRTWLTETDQDRRGPALSSLHSSRKTPNKQSSLGHHFKADKADKCAGWSGGRLNPSWDPQGPPEEGRATWGRGHHLGKGVPPGEGDATWGRACHLRKGTPPGEEHATWGRGRHLRKGVPLDEGDAPAIPMQGTKVQSLFWELKSRKLHSVAKKIFFFKRKQANPLF